ncbi:peptidoglycan-binding protein [Evansella sp. AB-P1]|uniref:C40 family peptidase n=1 Tax=Evansella sp. AB-P1 TaxID=3037653 RepID=UPI00241FC226|nr:peptidoglycan-binding protein [Evansella sp. AB-P1]MDG5787278.1 peptidoglycan-binding protein [Evansella sp. AB-P1]
MVFQSKIGTAIVTTAAATGVFLGAPTISEAAFGDQTLYFGMKNEDVVILQEQLKGKGYFHFHTATGYFGDITKKAVQDFQRDNNLKQDGIVGPTTFAALKNSTISTSTNTSGTAAPSTSNGNSTATASASSQSQSLQQLKTSGALRIGSRGEEVVKLQMYLKKAGFFDYHEATGYYGTITEAGVRRFQQARGLKVDGVASKTTLEAINKDIQATSTTVKTNSGSSTTTTNTGSKGSANTSNSTTTATSSVNVGSQLSASAPASLVTAASNLAKSSVTLREGNRGNSVKTLQQMLMHVGHFNYHEATGYYGTITRDGIRSFQRSTGLKVDGIANPQTIKALEGAITRESNKETTTKQTTTNSKSTNSNSTSSSTSSSNSSVKAVSNVPILQVGSRGNEVTELQYRLQILGHFHVQPTGYFGDITKNSVIQFQRQWGLVADGFVSQATWNKLDEVSSIHLSDAQTKASSSSAFNAINLIADAGSYIGTPYLWGGTTSRGFDCSGYVQYLFKKNGVHLPRTVADQWNATVSVSKPKVGDIVYFETYKAGPSHNGIYIGNNQFIHTDSTRGVTITSLSNTYWSQRYLGARRIK